MSPEAVSALLMAMLVTSFAGYKWGVSERLIIDALKESS